MKFKSKSIDWKTSDTAIGDCSNIFTRLSIQSFGSDGSVVFEDGTIEHDIDTVVYATGYTFSFPFLSDAGAINVEDNRSAF